LLSFAAVQLASYAFDASAAAPGTLPTRVPIGFGLAVYDALDRLAPAPYVESTLASYELAHGDERAASAHAYRLPASPERDELLARIAAAGGDAALSLEYYLAAPDVANVDAVVDARAVRDPAAAYALERTLQARLALLGTQPNAVAQAYWRMGELANVAARHERNGARRERWFQTGMTDLQQAADLAPLSEKYSLAAANQAMLLGQVERSRRLFAHVVDVNPASADGLAGMGVAAYRSGRTDAARGYLSRARSLDPNAGMVRALERMLPQ
jgi:tetratricopeptide (TPR) repeat protein